MFSFLFLHFLLRYKEENISWRHGCIFWYIFLQKGSLHYESFITVCNNKNSSDFHVNKHGGFMII